MSGLAPETAAWFRESTAAMQKAGIRRVLALSGDPGWSASQAGYLQALLPGDWLWVSDDNHSGHVPPSSIRTLLGREFLHAVLDAREGLAADGLAALAGTLTAGSWLVILVPDWDRWPLLADRDSLRWSEQPKPIATPNFVRHFRQSLQSSPEIMVIKQHQDPSLPTFIPRPDWYPPAQGPTAEQQSLLNQLLAAGPGIFVLTAPRGRGKSTLAGMLAARADGPCRVVAPARHATDVLARYAAGRAAFYSPDALLEYCRNQPVDGWLLVDEAAAIPMPLLRELIGYFPQVLLTTTVQGYEGTGRGFLLKFCAALPHWRDLRLSSPLRWAEHDPLECWLDAVLLMGQAPAPLRSQPAADPDFISLRRDQWLQCPRWLERFYDLLSSAHYRTTPLDLRRLMDAPGQHFMAARCGESLIGAVWSLDEGGLSPPLAHEVWAGRRRPPGNLVAQSLAAHGGLWMAPQLLSRRISRIAVAAGRRRQGIGRRLLSQTRRQAAEDGRDFLSVSFGLTEELGQFWQTAGFELVHIGSHLEASSGCYSAMALLPLTDAGRRLVRQAVGKFVRDKAWAAGNHEQPLDDDDWRTLAGFAFAHRPPEACRTALSRLCRLSVQPLPTLRHWLEGECDIAGTAERFNLTGRKTLLQHLRTETAEALAVFDGSACQAWQAWSGPLEGTSAAPETGSGK